MTAGLTMYGRHSLLQASYRLRRFFIICLKSSRAHCAAPPFRKSLVGLLRCLLLHACPPLEKFRGRIFLCDGGLDKVVSLFFLASFVLLATIFYYLFKIISRSLRCSSFPQKPRRSFAVLTFARLSAFGKVPRADIFVRRRVGQGEGNRYFMSQASYRF